MIKVKKIEWISEEIKKAEVTLTDGKYDIICFADSFENKDVSFEDQIYALFTEHIVRIDTRDYSIIKGGLPFNYTIRGKVIDKDIPLIKIGEFKLELDYPLPGDIIEGDFISFTCGRIDIF